MLPAQPRQGGGSCISGTSIRWMQEVLFHSWIASNSPFG